MRVVVLFGACDGLSKRADDGSGTRKPGKVRTTMTTVEVYCRVSRPQRSSLTSSPPQPVSAGAAQGLRGDAGAAAGRFPRHHPHSELGRRGQVSDDRQTADGNCSLPRVVPTAHLRLTSSLPLNRTYVALGSAAILLFSTVMMSQVMTGHDIGSATCVRQLSSATCHAHSAPQTGVFTSHS